MNFYRAISFFVLSVIFSFSHTFSQIDQNNPFELKTGKEAAIYSFGAAAGIIALVILSETNPLTEEEIKSQKAENVNWFDKIAIGPFSEDPLADALLYGSFILPVTFISYENTREDFGTLSLMYGEVILVNAAINGLVKGLTTRNRPFVYDTDSPLEEKYNVDARHSFYSGHVSVTASNSFFTARVFSEYLTNSTAKTLIWCGAALIPAVAGFSRVNTHNHFPTDVIVGYIVGAAIGYLIPELHKYENENTGTTAPDQFIHKPVIGFQFSF